MAILKRRDPHDFLKKTKEAVWPSQGWGRTFEYYRHRMFRTGDSTYKIAAGLASGVAVSWSPFMGTHFFQAVFLAWLLRANMLAGFIGTAFGNPWTFPMLFWAGYKVGVWICSLFGLSDFIALPPMQETWDFVKYLFDYPLKLLLPTTLGCYLCGLLSWPVAYVALYYPVRVAQTAYREKRAARLK